MSTLLRHERGQGVAQEDIAMPPLEVEPAAEAASQTLEEMFEEQDINDAETVPVPQAVAPVEQRTTPQQSFRELSEKAKRAERERDDLARRIQEMEQQRAVPHVHEEDDVRLNPDDLVEWKHVDKKMRRYEEQLQAYQAQSAASAAEMRLRNQYPDFERVVTTENVEQLRSMYPDIADSLSSNTDLYSKASSAYTLIKRLGIIPEEAPVADKTRAITNLSKPRPLTSISPTQGDTPLSKANAFANGLTPDLQKQLLKEMTDAMKNR